MISTARILWTRNIPLQEISKHARVLSLGMLAAVISLAELAFGAWQFSGIRASLGKSLANLGLATRLLDFEYARNLMHLN